MMPTREEVEKLAAELAKQLTDRGKLIEAGWVIFRGMTVSPNAPQVQIDEMRYAFMAGAQHLFGSIMEILDPGEEPTAADLRRMDLINEELAEFAEEMRLRHTVPKDEA